MVSVPYITPGTGSFIDAAGNVYTVDGAGNALENGLPIPGGSGTSAMELYNSTVYGRDAGSGQWYTWNQALWTAAASAPPAPSTDPTPTGGATSPPSTGATRDPTTIPFASNSVWNIGIGSNAIWSAGSDADAQQLHHLNGAINTATWGQPIYFGTASDPLVTVTDTDPLFPVPPQQIHIPISALPAAGSGGYADAHMSFYDATQPNLLWSYWGASFNNGVDVTGGIRAGLGGVWDITGDGITNTVSPGSDYDYAVGVITDYDMSIGAIDHAVRVAISTDALKSAGATWTQNIPWPNTHEDYYGPQIYTGNIVAGSTFGIPASVNLSSLGLSAGGMMLAKALQQYGGIWRDSGGANQITFYSTPNQANNPLIAQMQADMAKIIPQIEVLRNQGPNSINGGGTPLVPPLPPVSTSTSLPLPAPLPAPLPPPPAPAPITTGTGPDSLVLHVAEDAYQGDAQFTVSFDGKQLGGTFTAIALQSSGVTQDFIFKGDWSSGSHTVTVNFLNDMWGGTSTTDRNLYIDGLNYDGADTAQSAMFAATGARSFTVTDTTLSAAQSTITIASSDASPVVNLSNVTIIATSGNHMLFIGGSHDVAILTGGTESVQANQGYNTITTGKGNDTIRFGGSSNTINAGTGNNALYDSGSSNKIVMPGPGQGFDDIYGSVLSNGDMLDFKTALKATAWNGSAASLGNYLRVTMSGSDAIISMASKTGGTFSKVADLHGVGLVNLQTLLAHSIT